MSTKSQRAGIFDAIAGLAGRAADAYRRRRTAQIVSELPEYIRRDIGLDRDDRYPHLR